VEAAFYRPTSGFNRSPKIVLFFPDCQHSLATLGGKDFFFREVQMADRVFSNWFSRALIAPP
jgi:hypothetical protein